MITSIVKSKGKPYKFEGNLDFEGEIDKLGKIKWNAETCYPAGNGAVLEFKFESDQTYLNMLIKELDDIIIQFPVIGKP
ncbi:WapI family immunity protein [Sporosarcina luteola]|uniref:WapI family immunity protein n=1 Tax=Sporosarcina luteola TaxID=582850 RepID=UPI003EBCBDED